MVVPFVLASASPARRRLLAMAGISVMVYPSDFDESQIQITDPAKLVQVLAEGKARSTMQSLFSRQSELPSGFFSTTPGLILGCDSILAIDGEIHGKPKDPDEAIARWKKMRGNVGGLFTGHAFLQPYTTVQGALMPYPPLVRTQMTRVYFADISDRQIEAYVETKEPLSCAGCFALEGRGGLFVEKIEGCHTNVIGLSLPLLCQMLSALGYDVTDFWQDKTDNRFLV
ncbi:nucleoside triphosphate pyrophosphatase [Leptolyngbya sp. FACHB-17]|uniref:nucleoside triphosphate pyrophosphatase n=1 Tax=unclassified Leptolyngbya TaxID=2650499 RepID=UPI001680875A|nr:nucleoside triphosphate pyrophosphatase [Leptolyngbya sp. FACHB-17]MBD2078886.1 septum formation inhibitor Maf [Leptolyngbya sp. FACHB-17]